MVISMERWEGKVAVVTGASAGIGAAISEHLVNAGLKVVGLARGKEKLEELKKKLKGKPGRFYAVGADVTKEDDILKAFKWVKDNAGPVYILVNNAGTTRLTTLVDGDTKMWKEILDTNVLGLCIATREAVKDMRVNNVDGHIVHINSILGHKVANLPEFNVYHASKFAVTALTATLRHELNSTKSKIKITSISPGMVATQQVQACGLGTSEFMQKFVKTEPSLKASDVADAVIYALSTPPHVQIHELMIKPVGERN